MNSWIYEKPEQKPKVVFLHIATRTFLNRRIYISSNARVLAWMFVGQDLLSSTPSKALEIGLAMYTMLQKNSLH